MMTKKTIKYPTLYYYLQARNIGTKDWCYLRDDDELNNVGIDEASKLSMTRIAKIINEIVGFCDANTEFRIVPCNTGIVPCNSGK